MKKVLNIFFALAFWGIIFTPAAALGALQGEVKAAVSVAAIVPSKVCPQYSSVVSNVSEVLADDSQKILVTVKAYDCENAPVAGVRVVVTSNRGEIDSVIPVTALGTAITNPEGDNYATTDENGFAFLQIRSHVPGKAVLSTLVNNSVTLTDLTVTFLPLPFTKNVTVTVEVPKIISPERKITIFKPQAEEIDRQKLVNLGVEFKVPLWVFYLVSSLTLLGLLLSVATIWLLLIVRHLQKRELSEVEAEIGMIAQEEKDLKRILEEEQIN